MDPRELDRDVAGAASAHQRLLQHLDELSASGAPPDPARPSALPGWTVGHVLTHLARQADSLVRMLDGRPQYPSAEVREAQIVEGSSRPFDDLVADVRRSIWALESRWAAPVDWTGVAAGLMGDVALSEVPFRRWRETDVHHVDLDLGYTFADLPPDYVRLELRRMEMVWMARRPMGLTALPALALELPPHERLAWLMGRAVIDGLDPAGIF
jgi:maleylpyruvate isomerase